MREETGKRRGELEEGQGRGQEGAEREGKGRQWGRRDWGNRGNRKGRDGLEEGKRERDTERNGMVGKGGAPRTKRYNYTTVAVVLLVILEFLISLGYL